jgi:hypothetical protein
MLFNIFNSKYVEGSKLVIFVDFDIVLPSATHRWFLGTNTHKQRQSDYIAPCWCAGSLSQDREEDQMIRSAAH